MQDSEKRAKQKKGGSRGASNGNNFALDPDSQKLAKMAKSVGNETMRFRFDQGNASRDSMLQFITGRLGTIDQVQQLEVEACDYNSMREHWKQMADSQQSDVKLPDPAKWGESARLYERAAVKLANGELGTGAQYLQQAVDAEQRAFAAVSSTIDLDGIEEASETPASAQGVADNQAAQPCDLPDEMKLADKIQNVTTSVKDVPDNPRSAVPWWTDLEEEEEGEGDDAGGS
jgi:hypothetical protein